MKFYHSIIFVAVISLFTFKAYSQNTANKDYTSHPYWVEMMQDHSVNFYELQEAFEAYYIDRPKGKGSGYKQFRRWEFFMNQRVYPSGNRVNPASAWTAFMDFKHKNSSRDDMSNWTCLGPETSLNVTGHWSPGIGRINVIAKHPNDHAIIYLGAPSGGLWKTTDEGQSWTSLTDDIPAIGVSAIAINHENPETIYIGTGDKDANDTYSIGVLISHNGGQDWELSGLNWTVYQNRTIAKLLIHPEDASVIYAATTAGLYKSTNSGENWYEVLNGNIDDIEFCPGQPDIIYAITTRFFKSTDGGESFTETSGVPTSARAQISVSEANPDYVYFFSGKNGLYRSDDKGNSFSFRSNSPTNGVQDWYDLSIAVNQYNAEEVHVGEFNTWRSDDGGLSWGQTSEWTWGNAIGYTHCDIHEMVFFGDTLFVGSDGLICKSTNSGDDWDNLTEGIGIRQFYRMAGSKTNPYKLMGGSQDNGTSVYSSDYWHEWLGADGMECVIDWSNENIVYGTTQNGNFYKSNTGGNNGGVNIAQPGGGAWITPFAMHPQDHNTLFVANSQIRKTTDGMQSWTTISNFSGGNLNALAVAESDPDYIYTSRSGTIYKTDNGGNSWTDISYGLPNLYITYIHVHPSNPETLAVSFSGYEENEKVYISHDGGENWENYSANLPNLPANCVIFYNDPLEGIYVGMDVGVYYRDNTLEEWEAFMQGIPNVIINELEIQYESGLIRAATYGRGLWESPVRQTAPVAGFSADKQLVTPMCEVNFSNVSSGPPQSFNWWFEGGSPETSNDLNPQGIYWENPGNYDVKLVIHNAMGSDSLLMEDYITVSDELLPDVNFSADFRAICANDEVVFTDASQYCPTSWLWEISPQGYQFTNGTNQYSINPVVRFTEDGPYNISLTVSNSNGENTLTREAYILVGGFELPFLEDFESMQGDELSGWEIENPDNAKTWELTEVAGNEPGNKAAYVNIFNYVGPSQRDRLISPAFNLSDYNNASISFKYAYAQKYPQISDSLIVYISTDCGESWARIFNGGDDGSGNFATHELTTDEFIPLEAADWCGSGYGAECVNIDITNYTGLANIKFMFESYSFLGNNIFLDDVMLTNSVGIGNNHSDPGKMEIYPNPSKGFFTIKANALNKEVKCEIFSVHGNLVYEKNITTKNGLIHEEIDLDDIAEGVYLIKLRSGNEQFMQRIVLQ